MLEVDKEKIKKFFESGLSSDQIAENSGIAYTTSRELKEGKLNIDDVSFRILVKLTDGYKQAFEGYVPEEISLERRIAIADAAIGINKIDGIKLSDEYIEKFYDLANGRITEAEFAEYVLKTTRIR